MPFLITLWGWIKNPYVALTLLLAFLGGWLYWHNHSQATTITKQAAQITSLQGAVKSDKAVIAETKDSAKRDVTHARIEEQINSAPKADNASSDGSIPPVLLHTFDSLRAAHATVAD